MKEYLVDIAERYGGFVVGGLVGAIVHRIRNAMGFCKFLGVLFISAFVGFCVGVMMKNYLNPPVEVMFVACSISGVFSKDILDEIQQIIKNISDFVKSKLKTKNNESEIN